VNGSSSKRTDAWRSLAELAGKVDPDASREFPPGVDEGSGLGRRDTLRLLGASLMLAGLEGCTRAPRERIVPYAVQPPEITPGIAKYYATSMTLGGYATGLIVESHEGRPTKVEGNPDHPASLGAAGILEQASVLSLYDPSRLRGLAREGVSASWRSLLESLRGGRERERLDRVHVLMEPTTSPLVSSLLEKLRSRGGRVHYHAPVSQNAAWEGARIAFGRPLDTVYDLRAADVVLALDSDLLASGPFHLRYARQFANGRRIRSSRDSMNRLYVAEPALTVTGMTADHRLRVRALDVEALAAVLLREALATPGAPAWGKAMEGVVRRWSVTAEQERWARAAARDLNAHRGRGVVAVGAGQSPIAQAMGHLVNVAFGNIGSTVQCIESAILDAGSRDHDLSGLLQELDGGRVDTLLVLKGNPSYEAPTDLEFSKRIRRARSSVYLGGYDNETARDCDWLIPAAHYLESWSDARAFDGTLSFAQPLIAPLYAGKTTAEILSVLLGDGEPSSHDLMTALWRETRVDFEESWPRALARGVVDGTASPPVDLGVGEVHLRFGSRSSPPRDALEIVFRPDGRVHDGTFTNNAWLLELPDPISKLTWGNAALLSPSTARRLHVETGDMLELRLRDRTVEAPALVSPGHAEDSVMLHLGYGREGSEDLARGVGADAYRLRSSQALDAEIGLEVRKLDRRAELAITQEHWSMEGRPIALERSIGDYRRRPDVLAPQRAPPPTLYQLRPAGKAQWAMSIDLGLCTGCSACVVACQAENNIPIVGKEGVEKGREMHWLRIDRYFDGDEEDPTVSTQPMLCQHCEKAPCEYVCPVGATVHSSDGLNEMVYNRCVGTRFCSNNCPYKVRRFNWFNYNRDKPQTLEMVMNPDVTVRARGVMEKCTYCVQRIRETEIHARIDGRAIRDGEIRTACQQSCPAGAIVFGSIADPRSEVTALHANERTYSVLHELGTEPRTRYLVRLKNPNPELES
jgi:Fe-S-cluster-containing dehydrogenase component